MKPPIDLSNTLLEEARRVTEERRTTGGARVEARSRREVREGKDRTRRFRLRDESFTGQGLQPGVADVSGEAIREVAYPERVR